MSTTGHRCRPDLLCPFNPPVRRVHIAGQTSRAAVGPLITPERFVSLRAGRLFRCPKSESASGTAIYQTDNIPGTEKPDINCQRCRRRRWRRRLNLFSGPRGENVAFILSDPHLYSFHRNSPGTTPETSLIVLPPTVEIRLPSPAPAAAAGCSKQVQSIF